MVAPPNRLEKRMKIEFIDSQDCHCDLCLEFLGQAFAISGDSGIQWIWLCPKCLVSLRTTISPLSVLVQTGKDTNASGSGSKT
jgi:hypothetical protein